MNERVMAISRDFLENVIEGFTRMDRPGDLDKLFYCFFYGDRAELEVDKRYKQIIPYILIRRRDELLCYEREGSEKRLSGLLSIGVGGHVNPPEGIRSAALRELDEEVQFKFVRDADFRLAGILKEDVTDVGKVHIGVIYTFTVPDDTILESHETALRNVRFKSIESLKAKSFAMELWSAICIVSLNKIFP